MPANARSKQTRTALLALLGGLLGISVFLLVFGPSPLDVTNDAFCRGGYMEKDIQQHYAGWLFYRQSAGMFPFCLAGNINYPAGLSVAYTDSIPLFAAFFKLLSPLLPATFQYFGWFTLLCFALQGAFGALLLGLFSQSRVLPLIGDVLFVTSPILFERAFRHTSLGAQFLILGALYYYFKSRREDCFACPGLFILNVLAITIHPYFLPMTFAVTLALLAEYALRHRQFARPAAYLGVNLAATVGAGWVFGLFYNTATGGTDALYGYFSMNLNALWNPVGVGGVRWSRFLPVQNQVGGNYDAFAYLGLGVLAALAILAVYLLGWRRHVLFAQLRSHWMLCAVCLILSAFAVSNVVTANGATLFTLPLPQALISLCSVFRSSGRLFWPVYTLLFVAAFAGICRLAGRFGGQRAALIAAAALVAVQVADISPGLLQRHDAMRAAVSGEEAFPTAMTSTFWQEAAGRYAHLLSMDGLQCDALHLALYTADNAMTTNDPFAARYDKATLQDGQKAALAELQSGVLRGDTLYLFRDEGNFLQAVEAVRADAWCGHIEAQVLRGSADAAQDGGWYVIAPGMQAYNPDALAIPYDDAYPLRLAALTDELWNRGVLDSDKETICFKDSPFARARLVGAKTLTDLSTGSVYTITALDENDPGWLMLTLDIDDATILWDKELETDIS